MQTPEIQAFGDLLRQFRKRAGHTQAELAEKSGLAEKTVAALEAGRRAKPRRDTVQQIAKALDLAGNDFALFEATARGQRQYDLIDQGSVARGWMRGLPTSNDAETKDTDTAPLGPFGPPFDLAVLPHLERFVGREADVARVIDLLLCRDNDTDGQLANIAAANGMGGIGKTALATEVVRRLVKQGAFPDGIAVYDARKRTDPLAVLRGVLARFTPGRKEPGADTLEKLGDFAREIFKGKHALVVLDNVELHWPIDRVIEPLRSAGAVVLSTSRAELPVIPVEAQVKLELLPLEEAIDLFVEYYGRSKYHASDVAAITALVTALSRHTLAIKLAAANAATLNRMLSDMAAELAQSPQKALFLEDGTEAVRYVFASSVEALSDAAVRLFKGLAAFDSTDVGRKAVLAVANSFGDESSDQSLRLLAALRLVETGAVATMPDGTDRERVQWHSLTQDYTHELFARWEAGQRRETRRAVARWYAGYTNELQPTLYYTLSLDEKNITNALKWALIEGDELLATRIAHGMVSFWRDTGRTHTALTFLPQSVDAAAKHAQHSGSRDDQRRHAELLSGLGNVLQNVGRLLEAQEYLRQALLIHRELADRPGEGAVLSSLGVVAQRRGSLDEAETYYQQSLIARREVADRRGEGVDLYRLGQVAQLRGHLKKAEAYYRRSLSIVREVGDRRGEAVDLSFLGQVAQRRGRLDEAKAFLQQSLTIRREVQDRRGEGTDLACLGQILLELGLLIRARGLFQQALLIHHEVQDRRGECVDLSSLGQVAQLRGQLKKAEAYYQQSLSIRREVEDRRGEGVDLCRLGQVAQLRGHLDEAQDLLQRSLTIRREVKDQRGEGEVLAVLAELAIVRHEFDKAENCYRAAMALARRTEDSRNQIKILIALGELFVTLQRNRDECCRMFIQAADLYQQLGQHDKANQARLRVGQLGGTIHA